jgi:uracil-DNA glycosylase family 4
MRRVEGWGNPKAKLVIIGEAPGEREENVGQPFVGPAGYRLSEWMQRVGLQRQDAFIDNVFQHRPPGNKIGLIEKAVLEQWMGYLHERIAELEDPWVIVPTGNYALYALTGKGKVHWHQRDGKESRPGIQDWRGSILEYVDLRGRKLKCIPTIHPAATFREPGLERACVVDWERIAHELGSPDIARPHRQHHIYPTLSQLAALHQRACEPGAVLAIDIENPRTQKTVTVFNEDGTEARYKSGKKKGRVKTKREAGDPKIVCIGFSLSPTESLTVPTDVGYWQSKERHAEAWNWIRLLCTSPAEKVLHNGLYDTFFLADHGIYLTNWLWDTLYMHHALDPSSPHDLASCASFDTREPFWKHEAKDPESASQYTSNWSAFLTYNGKDVCVTRELFDVYVGRLGGLTLQGEPGLTFYNRHYMGYEWTNASAVIG